MTLTIARRLTDLARKLVVRLSRAARAPDHEVDLTDEYFFAGLDPQFEILRRSREAFDEGDTPAARSLILQHFRERTSPRFFFELERLTTLTREFRERHSEESRLLKSWTENASTSALPIYSTHTPGLTAGFRWDKIESGPGGDVLYPARPHRFAFAPRFALSHVLGESTLAPLQTAISNWLEYASGAGAKLAYISNLVAIYRILAIHWTLSFLGFGETPEEEVLAFELLKILHSDTRFLSTNFGQSAPNNHLLADGFGLWYASFLFPEFTGSKEAVNRGDKLFLDELDRQFYRDGSGFEQSVHYHELGCEMVMGYLLLKRRNRIPCPGWIEERSKRMLDFQLALAGPSRVPLLLGDATEDTLFPLSTNDGADVAALGQFHDFLFAEGWHDGHVPATSARAFWMLDGFESSTDICSEHPTRFFPNGGYFVLPEPERPDRLVFRTGPASDQEVFAGHMHADPLTVYLILGDTPVFVEAGTYTYAAKAMAQHRSWRRYFLGRESHNGLILPEKNPLGEAEENFRPRDVSLRVASTSHGKDGILWSIEGRILGTGPYTGCVRGVVHVCHEYWFIYDLLPEALERSEATVQFLLPPSARVSTPAEGTVDLLVRRESARLCYAGVGAPSVVSGQFNPPRGWTSPGYGELAAAPSLRFPLTGERTFAGFVIQPAIRDNDPSSLEIIQKVGWLAMRLGTELDGDVLFLSQSQNQDSSISLWGFEFTGRQAWVRTRSGRPSSLRWIDARALRWKGWSVKSRSGWSQALAGEFEDDTFRVQRGSRENLIVEFRR